MGCDVMSVSNYFSTVDYFMNNFPIIVLDTSYLTDLFVHLVQYCYRTGSVSCLGVQLIKTSLK